MVDLVNPQDTVVMVAAMTEREGMLVSIIAHVTCALSRQII